MKLLFALTAAVVTTVVTNETPTNPPVASAVATNKVAAAPAEPTVVTSDHMTADYMHNLGTFEGNVVVIDPRITVRADKMVVFFGGTNVVVNGATNSTRSIQRILADGGVVINQDKKKATSEHADYTTRDDKVILTGSPKVEGPEGTVTGKQITIWHGQQKMDVIADEADTNRTHLVIFPEEQRKKNTGEPPPPAPTP